MGYVWQRWLVAELRAAGLRVIEIEGWENRGRPASTGSFDPEGASTTHHTGPFSTVGAMLALLVIGRSDLPGPLSQIATGPDGTVYVIAAGRANHAGRVGKSGQVGMPLGSDGNARSIGNEVITDGTSPLPQAQREAIAIVNRVVTKHWDRPVTWAHRHADISGTGKWDIGQLTTVQLRADINAIRPPSQEDDMQLDDKLFPRNPDSRTVGDALRAVLRLEKHEAARVKRTSAQLRAIKTAVESNADKEEIKKMLENLDAEITIVVGGGEQE